MKIDATPATWMRSRAPISRDATPLAATSPARSPFSSSSLRIRSAELTRTTGPGPRRPWAFPARRSRSCPGPGPHRLSESLRVAGGPGAQPWEAARPRLCAAAGGRSGADGATRRCEPARDSDPSQPSTGPTRIHTDSRHRVRARTRSARPSRVCVRARACVCACVRACVRSCERACVRAYV